MKKKVIVAVVSAAAFMAAPAVAGAQNVKVYNAAGIPGWRVTQFERAAGQVANGDLRAHWGSRSVQWNTHRGWAFLLERSLSFTGQYCGDGAAACHRVLSDGTPEAIVDANQADTGYPWTVTASHELFEMLVDPYSNATTTATDGSGAEWRDEVADPVQDYSHWVRGVRLTDFVYPAWFQNAPGPQDAMGWLDDTTAGTDLFEFSCPTGYAKYWDPYLGVQTMGAATDPTCNGGNYMRKRPHAGLRMRAHAARRGFVVGEPLPTRGSHPPRRLLLMSVPSHPHLSQSARGRSA